MVKSQMSKNIEFGGLLLLVGLVVFLYESIPLNKKFSRNFFLYTFFSSFTQIIINFVVLFTSCTLHTLGKIPFKKFVQKKLSIFQPQVDLYVGNLVDFVIWVLFYFCMFCKTTSLNRLKMLKPAYGRHWISFLLCCLPFPVFWFQLFPRVFCQGSL